VTKGYDVARDKFDTRYHEVAIGCEACHGPGSAHIAWADASSTDARKGLTVQLDERRGAAWAIDSATGIARRSPERSSEREIEVCAQCHARRAQIAEDYRAGDRFLDHYVPSLLAAGLYHADGQQRDEVFIWGSWLQSKMHRQGVTCSDCHDPHTQKLRADGNAVCAQCHSTGKYDSASHHRHAPDSMGAKCVECHMPTTTYMVVDGRRDHSMRVPRPDQAEALGQPSACDRCHADRGPPWAAAAVRRWLGRDARGFHSFAPAFHAADTGRAAAATLAAIASDINNSGIVRASAIERMAVAATRDIDAARRAARDTDPLVRLASVRLGELLLPAEQAVVLGPLLSDPLRAIRTEAARVLAGAHQEIRPADHVAWERAADEYIATLRYASDRPESRVAMGTFHSQLGRPAEAQVAFASALELDARFVPAYVNGADLLRSLGNDGQAVDLLQQGITRVPNSATLRHSLGLAFARQGSIREALRELERAVQLAPDEPQYVYVYAVALNSTGRPADALGVLGRAAARWPEHREILFALATMQREADQMDAAAKTAQRLIRAYPADPEAASLQRELR
jgi:predicted CXXCH cytochrome family protein